MYGRWLSPDWSSVPAPVPYANLTNPQTLNLYAMVRAGVPIARFVARWGGSDNPESFADLDGHFWAPFDWLAQMWTQGDNPPQVPAAEGVNANANQGTNAPQTDPPKPQEQMFLSKKGLDFIKRHEGYSDTVYKDSAGNPTIGYGHLIKPGENFDKGISEKEATALLAQDVKSAVSAVNDNLKGKVSQTKFDALVDFTYNLGAKNLAKSTLLSNVNAGKDVTKENFTDWNHAGGRVVQGLTIRRTNEYNLFSTGEYAGP